MNRFFSFAFVFWVVVSLTGLSARAIMRDDCRSHCKNKSCKDACAAVAAADDNQVVKLDDDSTCDEQKASCDKAKADLAKHQNTGDGGYVDGVNYYAKRDEACDAYNACRGNPPPQVSKRDDDDDAKVVGVAAGAIKPRKAKSGSKGILKDDDFTSDDDDSVPILAPIVAPK